MKRALIGLLTAGLVVVAIWAGFLHRPATAETPTPHFIAEGYPARLSDWGMVAAGGGRIALGSGVVPYDLASPLFSDYAGKLRTLYVPSGTAARYDPVDSFDFPVGSVITKTFYYPVAESGHRSDGPVLPAVGAALQTGASGLDLSHVRLIETRILARRASGWVALPYVWNEDQSDAVLMRTGTMTPLKLLRADGRVQDVDYTVPNVNQCASCHTPDHASRKLSPIGPKARNLNRDFSYEGGAENQLAHWARLGLLTGAPSPAMAPRNVDYRDLTASLDARARAYLDINCSHCHSATGLARTTGLQLDANETELRRLGECKPPVAAGPGTGDHLVDVVPGKPDDSILVYRIAATDLGIRMPEVGRSIVHDEGVALIRQWIESLQGVCGN